LPFLKVIPSSAMSASVRASPLVAELVFFCAERVDFVRLVSAASPDPAGLRFES